MEQSEIESLTKTIIDSVNSKPQSIKEINITWDVIEVDNYEYLVPIINVDYYPS